MDHLPKPQLDWSSDGTLRSTSFGDIYFSVEGGIEETRYVFAQGNNLPERFNNTTNFTIAETGFGTGLNFFVTLDLWQQSVNAGNTPANAQLNFFSFEKYPLSASEILKAAEHFGPLKQYAQTLAANYPPTSPGIHTLNLSDTITLTLIFGDINETITTTNFQANAWYLDGFSPSLNPDMWSDTLFTNIPRLTAPNGSFATFTAAGFVRRALIAAGFDVKKVKGFGKKREMIVGSLT